MTNMKMRFDTEEELIAALDPGIRRTVAWLRDHGFDTTDSGDGVTKLETGVMDPEDVLDVPHVVMVTEPDELVTWAKRLAHELSARGIDLVPEGRGEPTLSASYDPANGSSVLILYGVNDEMLFGEASESADACDEQEQSLAHDDTQPETPEAKRG